MRAMGMSKRSSWCSLTRCRSRSSGPSKGGSPGFAEGSVILKASSAARSAADGGAAGSSASRRFCEGAFDKVGFRGARLELHRLAHLGHGALCHRAGLVGTDPDQLVEVSGARQQRLALLAQPLLVGSELLEELPL